MKSIVCLILSFLILIISFVSFSIDTFAKDLITQILNYSNLSEDEQEERFEEIYKKLIKLPDSVQIKHFTLLLDKYKNTDDHNYLMIVNKINDLYLEVDKDKNYPKFLNKAIEVYLNNNDNLKTAETYVLIAENFKNNGKLDSAVFYGMRAFDFYKDANQLNNTTALNHLLGDIHYYLELYEDAEKYYKEAIRTGEKRDDWLEWRKIVIYNNMGNIYLKEQRYFESFKAYKIVENQIITNQNSRNQILSKSQLARLYRSYADYYLVQNKTDSALIFIKMNLDLIEKYNFKSAEPPSYSIYGEINYDLKKYDLAESNFLYSQSLLDTNEYLWSSINYLGLSLIYSREGDYEKAFYYSELRHKNNSKNNSTRNSAKILHAKVIKDMSILKEEINKRNSWLLILGIFTFSITVLAFVIVIYNRKLNKLYKSLYNSTIEKIKIEENFIHSFQLINDINIENQRSENLDNNSDDFDNSEFIDNQNEKESEIIDKEIEDKISPELELLAIKVNHLLNNSELLRNQELNINDIAKISASNRTYISKAINLYYKQSFQVYINEMRVKYLIHLLEDEKYKNMKMDELLLEVGFKNRVTFTKSFQKYTGLTPANFLKNIKSN